MKNGSNAWKPIKACRRGPNFSHLFFVDDILLFADATEGQVDLIKHGLEQFCSISRQHVSFEKSHMFFSSNVTKEEAVDLSNRLRVPRTDDLGKYLGYNLLYGGRNTKAPWELLQKATLHLLGWKLRCLSKVGRLTLASSVLNTLPIFHMQIMKLLVEVLRGLDRMCRKCFWGEEGDSRRLHLVNRETICKQKSKGGMGIRRAEDIIKAVLTKLLWRMYTE